MEKPLTIGQILQIWIKIDKDDAGKHKKKEKEIKIENEDRDDMLWKSTTYCA